MEFETNIDAAPRQDGEAIEISQSGLIRALNHVRDSKREALDHHRWEDATAWRNTERAVAAALGGIGLMRPEAT